MSRVICVNTRVPALLFALCAHLLWSYEPPETATLRGVIHDPQHRPVPDAQIAVAHPNGPAVQAITSDAEGAFELHGLAPGAYLLSISAPGFQPLQQTVSVELGRSPVFHLQLDLQAFTQTVEVTSDASKLTTDTSTVQTNVSRKEISQTPGADLTNSMAMVTDFTPGASMVHDMLHLRGGHQVNWFFDGIPVVNTNIAANLAPLVNPKDVEDLQTERGGYSSAYGDRTYGFFNVVTPSGFDRDNEAELIASAGNFNTTDDEFNIGSHTQKFAYYASVDGNQSDLGLAPPVPQVNHDATHGIGGFLSLLYNPNASDQFRWISSLRGTTYQVPNTENQAAGMGDLDQERDYLLGFTWTHSFSASTTLMLTPYVHLNRAQYAGGSNDTPYTLNDNIRSAYIGGRSVLQTHKEHHDAVVGVELWAERDNTFFGLTDNPGGAVLNQQQMAWANSDSAFVQDQYKPFTWLTFDLGLRFTHYGGLISEHALDPRLGAAVVIPRIKWIVRGYYAYYYQPPPLDSLQGPSLQFAAAQGYGFVPLRGERDLQHDFGLTIPIAGWSVEADQFHTSARNFLDHDVIGNSGIFIPLTDLGAVISGTEVSIRSPRLRNHANIRVAYSNQIAQGLGPITGGLLEDAPTGHFLLDHDQRNTASAVLSISLPHSAWITPTYAFGSGFLNGNGPAHLPPHSTFDLAAGKNFGENWTISANAINVANSRYLIDTSNTFGGTHWVNPRQIYGEVRYRFHF